MADYPGRYPLALWQPAHPDHWEPGRFSDDGIEKPQADPEAEVRHRTQGGGTVSWWMMSSEERIAAGAAPQGARSCTHFLVLKQGDVIQAVDVHDTAYANGIVGKRAGKSPMQPLIAANLEAGFEPNKWTVSVEYEGFFNEPLTEAQEQAGEALSAWLTRDVFRPNAERTGYELNRERFGRHDDISDTDCPGWSQAKHTTLLKGVQSRVALLDKEAVASRTEPDAWTLALLDVALTMSKGMAAMAATNDPEARRAFVRDIRAGLEALERVTH